MPQIVIILLALVSYSAKAEQLSCENLEAIMAKELGAIAENFTQEKAREFHPRLSEYWEVKESCEKQLGDSLPFDKAMVEVSI